MSDDAAPAGMPDGPDPGNNSGVEHEDALEKFGDSGLSVRHGKVNGWLLVVYGVALIWSFYYAFNYWGGLGPGLDY